MRNHLFALATLSFVATSAGTAQSAAQTAAYDSQTPRLLFAIVKDSQTVAVEDDWRGRRQVLQYTGAHPGSYIVFLRDQQLYRLTDPAQITQLQTMAAPLLALGKEQERLAALQVPLAARQQQLARQMQTAVGPEGVGRVGQEQGKVGDQQGRIGQQQGQIGQQQGDIFEAVRKSLLADTADCLNAGRCMVVQAGGVQEKGPA